MNTHKTIGRWPDLLRPLLQPARTLLTVCGVYFLVAPTGHDDPTTYTHLQAISITQGHGMVVLYTSTTQQHTPLFVVHPCMPQVHPTTHTGAIDIFAFL